MMDFWIVLLISFLCSAVGFVMYIYFFSVGYGLAVAGIALALLIGFWGSAGLPETLVCLLLVFYGLRLAGYLLIRDQKSAGYRKVLNPERERSKKMPFGPKVAIWTGCALLYFLETCPVYFRLQNGTKADAMLWAGAIVMALGILLELLADIQKSAAKKASPRRFVDTGLYRFVRCPNYLGEVILWLGVLLTGVTSLRGLQWLAAISGYVLIIYVMISGARRLEIRQDKNYGSDPEYQKYVKTVPILFPFIPLYSVKKYKIFAA